MALYIDEIVSGRRSEPRRRERYHERLTISARIREMKDELRDIEELSKKGGEKEKGKNSLLTAGQWCFVLCFGTVVFGPFILWAQLVALHQAAQVFVH